MAVTNNGTLTAIGDTFIGGDYGVMNGLPLPFTTGSQVSPVLLVFHFNAGVWDSNRIFNGFTRTGEIAVSPSKLILDSSTVAHTKNGLLNFR